MTKPKLVVAFATLILLSSCSDIVEKDLSGYGVILLTPPADYSTTTNQVQFKWEEVPHATEYRLQIASPDFLAPIAYLLDSTISKTSWVQDFLPGGYQWRVRAQNSSSHTEYFTRGFNVLATEDLTGLVPILVSPNDGYVSAQTTQTFAWDTLPFTNEHLFELRENDMDGTTVTSSTTQASEITVSAIAEGRYAWCIQAQNALPSHSEFACRSITVDTTPPSLPVQLGPAAAASIPNTSFLFTWQSGVDALTVVSDSLVVRDATLQVIRAIGGLGGVYSDSLGTGSYSWSIKSIDQAGNYSMAGPISFTVQ